MYWIFFNVMFLVQSLRSHPETMPQAQWNVLFHSVQMLLL